MQLKPVPRKNAAGSRRGNVPPGLAELETKEDPCCEVGEVVKLQLHHVGATGSWNSRKRKPTWVRCKCRSLSASHAGSSRWKRAEALRAAIGIWKEACQAFMNQLQRQPHRWYVFRESKGLSDCLRMDRPTTGSQAEP